MSTPETRAHDLLASLRPAPTPTPPPIPAYKVEAYLRGGPQPRGIHEALEARGLRGRYGLALLAQEARKGT